MCNCWACIVHVDYKIVCAFTACQLLCNVYHVNHTCLSHGNEHDNLHQIVTAL